MAAESKVWPRRGTPPDTILELVLEVITADRALGSLAKYMRALREGVHSAGTPALHGGASVVVDLRRALDDYIQTLKVIRAAFDRFLVDHSTQPESSVHRLLEVLDSPEGHLGTSFKLDDENPALARAIRSVTDCVAMAHALGKADDGLTAATRLVQT
jgi:hypothetical protein